ncbi:MAG: hypothetical protein AB1847_16560 [bacterium]
MIKRNAGIYLQSFAQAVLSEYYARGKDGIIRAVPKDCTYHKDRIVY